MADRTSVEDSVEHLFRRNAGQMSAVLTRIFGFDKFDLVEDAIQESMIRALKHWGIKGIPTNPNAWLIQVARNVILDGLRKSSRLEDLDEETRQLDQYVANADTESVVFANEIREDQLRMIFACCHPSITPDSRVALTLKTVGGFSVGEIARAFLSRDDAVAKMITRAKQGIRRQNSALSIPGPAEISDRLEAVIKVLYLMFNEGYSATSGEVAVRKDLCYEAIRLARLLADHPLTSLPKVHALSALFFFQASRLPARSGEDGALILLARQDRSLWDCEMIAEGLRHFRMSASGDELTVYHLEAEIASYHVLSESYEKTNWPALVAAYDALLSKRHSPIAALNRIIAFAEVEGAEAALDELESLRDAKLEVYYPFHVTLAEMRNRVGRPAEAMASYEFAVGLVDNEATKRFLKRKMEGIRSAGS